MKEINKLKGENVRDYAYRTILYSIITLELPPGSMVSENELSEKLNVSRTPVREALLEMRRLGLVESFPQRGSYVTRIDYKLIDDANFIRLSLEIAIVRLACRQGIPPGFVKKLRENIESQKQHMNVKGSHFYMLELDNVFHELLFESVGKLRAHEFMQEQIVHFDRLRNLEFRMLQTEKSTRTVMDHENILYAIEQHDEELAEMVMTRHLSRHLHEKEELSRLCPEYFK